MGLTKNLNLVTKSLNLHTKNPSLHTRNPSLHTRNPSLHTKNLSLHTKNQKQPTNSLQITMPRNPSTVSNPSYLLLPHLPKCTTKPSLPTISPAGQSSVLSTSLNQLLRWLGIFTK